MPHLRCAQAAVCRDQVGPVAVGSGQTAQDLAAGADNERSARARVAVCGLRIHSPRVRPARTLSGLRGVPRAVRAVHGRGCCGAVVGLAAWGPHPLWPETCLGAGYCHPHYWDRADDLLGALSLPDADRYVAYGDPTCEAKTEVLKSAGFRRAHTLAGRLAAERAENGFVDVAAFEKR